MKNKIVDASMTLTSATDGKEYGIEFFQLCADTYRVMLWIGDEEKKVCEGTQDECTAKFMELMTTS